MAKRAAHEVSGQQMDSVIGLDELARRVSVVVFLAQWHCGAAARLLRARLLVTRDVGWFRTL